jgi:hypothetical protein
MPDYQDSSSSGAGDADVEGDVVADGDGDGDLRREEEEDSSDNVFDAGEGAVISDRLSLRAASEIGQSGSSGGTEDDFVGPVTPSAANTNTNTLPHNTKPTAVEFSRTIPSDSTDLGDEEWVGVDPTPIPTTPLDPAPPAFPPLIIAKTKSSSSAKSRKRKEVRAHVPFPSSMAEGVQEDKPDVSTPRGHEGAGRRAVV